MTGSSVSVESPVFNPSAEFKDRAYINSMKQYRKMYKRSIEDPDGFWSEVADDFYWR